MFFIICEWYENIRGLTSLEVGEIGIVQFGQQGNFKIVHELGKPFGDVDGENLVNSFNFDQDSRIGDAPVIEMLSGVMQLLNKKKSAGISTSGGTTERLLLVITFKALDPIEPISLYGFIHKREFSSLFLGIFIIFVVPPQKDVFHL